MTAFTMTTTTTMNRTIDLVETVPTPQLVAQLAVLRYRQLELSAVDVDTEEVEETIDALVEEIYARTGQDLSQGA